MLDQKIIDEIKERYQKTTPAPWTALIEDRDFQCGCSFIKTGGEDIYLSGAAIADYDFIAHARQDIPLLLQEIERFQKLCSTWNIPERVMTIPEFFRNYDFHDSTFRNMEYDFQSRTLKLSCQFCNFLQKDYQDFQPTNSDILIIFQNAGFSGSVSDYDILNQKLLDDNTIHFFLENWNGSEFFEFSVSADSVLVVPLVKYNL